MKVIKKTDVQDVTPKGETLPSPAPGTPAAPPSPAAGIDDVLKDLNEHAASTESAAARQEEKTEQRASDQLRDDVLDMLELVAKPAKMFAWFLKPEDFDKLWGEKVQQEMAGPIANIMRRNGWDMKGLVHEFGPYAALAVAMGPSVYITARTYKQARQWQREEAGKTPVPPDGNPAT